MNIWMLSAICLLLVMFPCLWICLRASIFERFIGLQLAQTVAVLIMLMLSQVYSRDFYIDAALVLAVLSLASGLVFIRFLERWL